MDISNKQMTVSAAAVRLGAVSTREVAAISPVAPVTGAAERRPDRQRRSMQTPASYVVPRHASGLYRPLNPVACYLCVAQMSGRTFESATGYRPVNVWV
ncbi:MAG TPA: hypothetical protein ENJ64_01895 [Thiotrichales bacterium]|nr:hypothetical protein [Thiotrichales bacterium]